MASLLKRAILYELTAMILVFLVSWAWEGSLPRATGLTAVLFVVLTGYYFVFHLLMADGGPRGGREKAWR